VSGVLNDLQLLRKYEPVARFTKGESFFPIAAPGYIKECSLWLTDPRGKVRLLVPQGQLDVDRLVDFDELRAGHRLHLRFVDEPLEGLQYQRWWLDPKRKRFVAPGRLARVPLHFRIADSLFDLSLLVRGQVPGGLAAAADLKNRTLTSQDPRRVYYGRVTRSAGWIALQYLYFYAMNNWRSAFSGVNDHEADWEQAIVYLADSESGEPEPCWVAFASHDFEGDDLRRRWDDPQLVREGDHPVIFVGAGSHASYFERGDYLMSAKPGILRPLRRAVNWLRNFWRETLGMGSGEFAQESGRAAFSVPFIDYARGDGLRIGPGQEETWHAELIAGDIDWVHNYRGLWGLDTRDPLGGERAPAGPKYNRDGSVRQSWYDPIGWSGLDKVSPPDQLPGQIAHRLESMQGNLSELGAEIEVKLARLRERALDAEALKATEYPDAARQKSEDELEETRIALEDLQLRRAELAEAREALESYAQKVAGGDLGSPTAHLRNVHRPEPPLSPQHRIVEIWGAISVAAILLGIVLLLVLHPENWLLWLIGSAAGLGAVEALTRGRLINYLLSVVIILATIAAIILLVEFWFWVIVFGLILIAIFMIRGNLRELWQ
jgi:hypothetical protein